MILKQIKILHYLIEIIELVNYKENWQIHKLIMMIDVEHVSLIE